MWLRLVFMLGRACCGEAGREGERASGFRISPLLDAARRAWRHIIGNNKDLERSVQCREVMHQATEHHVVKLTLASYGGICSPHAASSACTGVNLIVDCGLGPLVSSCMMYECSWT